MAILGSRRRFDVACACLATAIVVLAGSGAYIIREGGRATAVPLEDVIADFRAAPSDTATPEAAAPVSAGATTVAEAAPVSAAGPVPGATVPAPQPAAAPGPAPITPVGSAGPAAGPVRPAEGVYRYAAEGGESISMAGGNRSYPGEVYAIVRHTACGHTIEVRVIEEHIDRTELCAGPEGLFLVREAKTISFFGQRDSGDIACDPPMPLVPRGAVPGTTTAWDCEAGTNKATGTVTRGADVTVDVGGVAVGGTAVEWRWQAHGQGTGRGVARWVFDPSGLPLRMERASQTTSDSALGRVRYEEDATFVLASTVPQR